MGKVLRRESTCFPSNLFYKKSFDLKTYTIRNVLNYPSFAI